MKRKPPTSAQIKKWLKAHGHETGKVDKLKLSTSKEKLETVIELHKKPKEKVKA